MSDKLLKVLAEMISSPRMTNTEAVAGSTSTLCVIQESPACAPLDSASVGSWSGGTSQTRNIIYMCIHVLIYHPTPLVMSK